MSYRVKMILALIILTVLLVMLSMLFRSDNAKLTNVGATPSRKTVALWLLKSSLGLEIVSLSLPLLFVWLYKKIFHKDWSERQFYSVYGITLPVVYLMLNVYACSYGG